MDPITAVGFAASILTFVDFSWSLLTGTCEVYRSVTGATVENAHIITVITDLEEVADELHTEFRKLEESKHAKALRRLARECLELSQELSKLLKKLKRQEKNSIWKSFKVKWDSMRKSEDVESIKERLEDYRSQILLRLTVMLRDEHSEIAKQLNSIKTEATLLKTTTADQLVILQTELLLAIEKKNETNCHEEATTSSTISASQSDSSTGNNLDSDHKGGRDESLQDIRELLASFQLMTTSIEIQHRILRQLTFDSMYSREEMIHVAETGTYQWMLTDPDPVESSIPQSDAWLNWSIPVPGLHDLADDELALSPASSDMTDKPNELWETVSSVPTDLLSSATSEHQIRAIEIESTHSESMIDNTGGSPSSNSSIARSQSSNESPENTWLQIESLLYDQWFCEEEDRQFRTRGMFLSWLRDGNYLCHTSGKAGSGKSTLMKFLWHHPRTRQELEAWAHPKKLVFSHFYFWKSAKDKWQMTLQGLYRSILFEVLSQCPDLMSDLFPKQWEIFHARFKVGDKSVESSLFRESMIKEAFDILVTRTSYEQYRFCFFIDGLDEFDSDVVAHWQLAKDLQRWTSGDDIKIYASSRPHSPFLVTFAEDRNIIIHLHELNRRDIYLFSRQMFEKDPNFKEVEDSYLELVVQIVKMSEGVFLWAWLVVRILLSSIGQLDDFHMLKQKLNTIPKGLDELYEQLLGTIGESDRCRSDDMLLLTLMNPFPEPLNVHVYGWLDDLKNPHFPPVQGQNCFSEKELETRRHRIQRQLDGLTKGLLEVTASNRRSESSFFQWQVQFFHLTARDFLRGKSEQLLRSFLASDPVEWYGRLRIAEFVFGIAVQDPHTMTRNSADPSHPETFLIETFKYLGYNFGSKRQIERNGWPYRSQLVDRFKLSTQAMEHRISEATSTVVYPGIPRSMWSYGNRERSLSHIRGSLLHLAVYYDLQQCVLYEILQNPQLLKPHGYTSLLISAIARRNVDLVATLLEWGASPQDTFSISHRLSEGG